MRAAWVLFQGLNLTYFRTHALRVALSMAGIGLGVMLLFGAIIDNASTTGSLGKQNLALQGVADLELTTAAIAGVPQSSEDIARRVDGVAAVAPVLHQHVVIRGAKSSAEVVALGYDGALQNLSAAVVDRKRLKYLADGPGLAVPAELLRQLGGAQGGGLVLVIKGRPRTVPVVAEIPGDVGAQLNQGHLVAMPLPLAQELLGHPGRLTSLLVRASDRRPAAIARLRVRLENALGNRVQALDADHTLMELQTSTEQLRSVTNFLALLAVLLGGYVVFITMSMAAVERRREFAIMLALGDSPRRLLARFLAEAAIMGTLGSLVGLVGGYFVGRYLTGGTPDFLQQAYDFHSQVQVPAAGVVGALAAGILASLTAAIGPAVSLLRLAPAEALRAEPLGEAPRGPRSRLLATAGGAIMMVAGIAGALLFAKIVFAGLTFVGAVLILPELLTRALRGIARELQRSRLRKTSGLTQLVSSNLMHSPRRTVAAVSAAALSLSLVIGFAGTNADVSVAIDRFASKFLFADLVANPDNSLYIQTVLSPDAPDRLRSLPGVREVYPVTFNFMHWGGRRINLISQDPAGFEAFGLDFREGDPAGAYQSLAGDGIIVSTQIAQLDRVHVGDTVTLPTPTGMHRFFVRGVVEDLGWTEGVFVIGNSAFHRYFQQAEWNQVLIKAHPGTSVDKIRAGAQAILGREADVRPGTAFVQVIRSANDAIQAPFTNMRNVSVVVAILAVLNTLLVSVLQRRREIGILFAIGLSRRQLAAALFAEAGIMVALALVAGAALGITLQALGIVFLDSTTGLPLRFHFELAALFIGIASAAVIAVAGSLYPAREAVRVPVLEAIAYE